MELGLGIYMPSSGRHSERMLERLWMSKTYYIRISKSKSPDYNLLYLTVI